MTITQIIVYTFLFIGALFGGIFIGAVILTARAWIRGITEPDEVDRRAPRARTRIKNSPIETEIADALARELPPHKRARSA